MPTLIVVPDLTGAPLAALKEWLAISGPREDALLLRLLAAGWETCARFVEPSAMPADWAGLPSAARADRLARARQRRPEGHRWRSAPYLWPLFAN